MKKFILAALVLGCVAGVHAEGEEAPETRKIVEAPAPELAPETRGVEFTPEQVPAETRTIVEVPAPAEEA